MTFSPAEQATSQYDEDAAGELPQGGQSCSDRECLLQVSPSVLRMTQEIAMLSASFPARLLMAMKKLIENPAIGIHHHVSHDSYTTMNQLRQLPRQMLYQFSLPLTASTGNDFAFVQFDPRLSTLLTAICFGGSIAAELSLPTPGTEGRPVFSRIGKQLLDQLVETLAKAWQEVCAQHLNAGHTVSETTVALQIQWLGAIASSQVPFTDDCLQSRFDLNFQDPFDTSIETTIPICLYTPVTAFTEALVQADTTTSTDSDRTKDRIARFLGQIDVTTLVDLAPVTLSLNRLRTLRAGDILPISDPNRAVMHIAGQNLFRGTTGQRAGYLTLQIDNCGGQVSE